MENVDVLMMTEVKVEEAAAPGEAHNTSSSPNDGEKIKVEPGQERSRRREISKNTCYFFVS